MTLDNHILAIEVSGHGAELVSLRKDGREYLWTGDAAFWNRHAPILFPVVGKSYGNTLHVDGTAYAMKQHGFARDSMFEPKGGGAEPDSLTLALVASGNDAIAQYPYRLGLEVCYRLRGNAVVAAWTVVNHDVRDAYFQIGAHPGFLLPDYNPDAPVHGYIRYYDREGRPVAPVVVSALDDGNRIPLADGPVGIPSEMPIVADTFVRDALMFEDSQVSEAVLCDPSGERVLGVSCPQAEAYGIWAPHKPGCPFVCLEPWCGICDSKGFTADIAARRYIHRLAPNGKYTFTYTIELYR